MSKNPILWKFWYANFLDVLFHTQFRDAIFPDFSGFPDLNCHWKIYNFNQKLKRFSKLLRFQWWGLSMWLTVGFVFQPGGGLSGLGALGSLAGGVGGTQDKEKVRYRETVRLPVKIIVSCPLCWLGKFFDNIYRIFLSFSLSIFLIISIPKKIWKKKYLKLN